MRPKQLRSTIGTLAVVVVAAVLLTWIGTGAANTAPAHLAGPVAGEAAVPDASPAVAVPTSAAASHSQAALVLSKPSVAPAGGVSAAPTGWPASPSASASQPISSVESSVGATHGFQLTGTGAAPIAVADTYTTPAATTLVVSSVNGVLSNDSDPEGDPITAVIATGPTGATLTLAPNGAFSFTPNATTSGDVTFTYKASDGTSLSAATTVTVTVGAASTGGNTGGGTGGNTGGGGTGGSGGNTGGGGSTAIDGAGLYLTSCSGCHGATGGGGAGPALTSANSSLIFSKVTTGSMKGFAAAMSSAEIQALVNYITAGFPPATPGGGGGTGGNTGGGGNTGNTGGNPVTTGPAAVFNTFCASCHGVDGGGTPAGPSIAGEDVGEILATVRAGDGAMPGFPTSAISDTDLADLADYVSSGLPPAASAPDNARPPDPVATFNAICASCHGVDGGGTPVGPSIAGEEVGEILATVRAGDGTMPGFPASAISDATLADLAAYVSGLRSSGHDGAVTVISTGASIYAGSCASCHGADATGTPLAPGILGEKYRSIIKTVRLGEDSMPAFSKAAISDADLDTLAGWLSGDSGSSSDRSRRDHRDGDNHD